MTKYREIIRLAGLGLSQTNIALSEYSVRIMQLFRTFSAGHPEIRCSDSGCQCSPL